MKNFILVTTMLLICNSCVKIYPADHEMKIYELPGTEWSTKENLEDTYSTLSFYRNNDVNGDGGGDVNFVSRISTPDGYKIVVGVGKYRMVRSEDPQVPVIVYFNDLITKFPSRTTITNVAYIFNDGRMVVFWNETDAAENNYEIMYRIR